MQVFRGRAELAVAPARPSAPALAIGNFDGVHRGHRTLIETARRLAAGHGAPAGVLTFDPHPAKLFAPALAPPLIVPLERRLELLAEAGADFVVVEPFTRALASVEAEPFVIDILGGELRAREVVVGYDFSFGRGRAGTPALLATAGARVGIAVTVVPAVQVDGLTCSSTKIREFVLEGRVEGAELLLGRPFEITGPVVPGAGRGRTIGIPTANVRPEGELLPKGGVYAAIARVLDGSGGAWPAALNVGTNPTFETGGGLTVEAHLLGFAGDLYGRRVRLELRHRLRDERRFPNPAALVEQIRDDVARARALLGS